MRLIDADVFKKEVSTVTFSENLDVSKSMAMVRLIESQPTACENDTCSLINAMAKKLLRSDFGRCALCDNYAKNITIDGVNNGCDGNCRHDKDYAEKDIINWFEKQLQWQKKKGAVKDE